MSQATPNPTAVRLGKLADERSRQYHDLRKAVAKYLAAYRVGSIDYFGRQALRLELAKLVGEQ